jgi:hypothetical protein
MCSVSLPLGFIPHDRVFAVPQAESPPFVRCFAIMLQEPPVFAEDVGVAGMMRKLLRAVRDAIRSPVTTALELAAYVKYHRVIARFPVFVDEYSLRPIALTVPSELCCCNPSIIATKDGWLVTIRTHNLYSVKDDRIHKIAGVSLWNENWLVSYTDDFHAREQKVIAVDDSVVDPETRNRFLPNGVADYRIFKHMDEYYLLGYGTNIRDHLDTMVLCRLAGDRVTRLDVLRSPNGADVEKNWMPVESDGELAAIYNVNPFALVSMDDGTPRLKCTRPYDNGIAEYRGSSQAIRYKDGMLCIVHRTIIIRWRRIYLHRFVWFDKNWDIALMSKEFFIERKGSEFCAGLANKGDRYVVSYGVRDVLARAVEMPASLVERLLAGA